MDNTLELWAYLLSNTGAIVAGGLLTGLSVLAYRRNPGRPSYRFASLGFGLILLGTLIDPVFLFRMSVGRHLTITELLALQFSEDILFAAGLGALFYAIVHHGSATPATADAVSYDDERAWRYDPRDDD